MQVHVQSFLTLLDENYLVNVYFKNLFWFVPYFLYTKINLYVIYFSINLTV